MLRIIKFALPLAAMVCFGAIGVSAETNSSKKSSSKTSESARKKSSSSSKKSAKARKTAKNRKAKGKQTSTKSKAKPQRNVAEVTASQDWIDELPPVELPEVDGPPEDQLLEPVPESPETDESP